MTWCLLSTGKPHHNTQDNESMIKYLWTANKGQDPFHQDFGSTQPWSSANNANGVWKKLVCETFSVSVNVERGAPGFLDIPDHEGQVIFPTKAHLWNIWDLRRPLEWNISLIFEWNKGGDMSIFTRCWSAGSIAREVTVAWWVSCLPTYDQNFTKLPPGDASQNS